MAALTAFPISVEKREPALVGKRAWFPGGSWGDFLVEPRGPQRAFPWVIGAECSRSCRTCLLSSGSLTSDLLLTSLDLPTLPVPRISLCPG